MKSLLVTLLLLIGYSAYGQNGGSDLQWEIVYDKSTRIAAADTLIEYFEGINLYSDTLSFIVEVIQADSLDAANRLSGDSLAITVKMLPRGPGGATDTTTVPYWTTVVSKTATQGRVAFGTDIPLLPSHQFTARGYISAINTTSGYQNVQIRVYAIRKFRRS